MKTKLRLLLLLLFVTAGKQILAQPSAGGVVYGPKGAFNITAPKGWSLDPSAGADDGLPCVLYPKGSNWETADPLMYAKIASTQFEDAEAFAKFAIEDMKAKRPGFEPKRIASGKTAGDLPYFINEYPSSKAYKRFERVAYVQLPKAVAFIVYSADKEAAFRKHQEALEETAKSLLSMNVDYPGKPEPGKPEQETKSEKPGV